MTQKVVDLRAFAKLAGLEYSTMRKYHQRAAQRRAEVAAGTADSVAEWMLPAPDAVVGRTPMWFERTANKWIANRPRAGAKAAAE